MPAHKVARKPRNLTMVQAAAAPLAGITALMALENFQNTQESIKGKTVFVSAGRKSLLYV